jgi:hypothetical protein
LDGLFDDQSDSDCWCWCFEIVLTFIFVSISFEMIMGNDWLKWDYVGSSIDLNVGKQSCELRHGLIMMRWSDSIDIAAPCPCHYQEPGIQNSAWMQHTVRTKEGSATWASWKRQCYWANESDETDKNKSVHAKRSDDFPE